MSLWLPSWPIDRRRRRESLSGREESGRPTILVASIGNQRLVTAADGGATALGIAPGMALTDARALHPGLAVAAADPVGDRAALQRLAQWCDRFSPWTAAEGADGVWLDITGCAHLHGSEASLAAEVVERLGRQGIAARAAIADTAGAAWALAHHGAEPITIVPAGQARAALAPLPVSALRLDPLATAELERLGLRRIGTFYELPRAALAARFGDRVALRLDQALGVAGEPLSPLPPPPARWTRRRFAEPIGTPEDIAAATRLLLTALCRALAAELLGARRVVLTLHRVDGRRAEVAIGTAQPSRDAVHLFRLLEEHLPQLDPGLGVEDMVLAAPTVDRLAATQLDLPRARLPDPTLRRVARSILEAEGMGRDGGDPAALATLVDRLANRLGAGALFRLMPRESHVPERAVACLFPLPPVSPRAPTRLRHAGPSLSGPAEEGSATAAATLLRPIRLLPRPEPIEAVAPVPDDPPVQFRWRRLMHRVRRADGPERIAGEWWRGAAEENALRDYYCVEDEAGRRFWLYRAGLYRPDATARWFLHGVFA